MQFPEQWLLEQPLFRGLGAALAVPLAGCTRAVAFESGTCLFREAQPADEFFVLETGVVALEVHAPGRPNAVIGTLGGGDLLGISWLVPPHRWSFDARALERTCAIAVDARRLRAQCEADHDLGYELLKRLTALLIRRLQGTRLQLIDIYGSPAR